MTNLGMGGGAGISSSSLISNFFGDVSVPKILYFNSKPTLLYDAVTGTLQIALLLCQLFSVTLHT